MARYLLDTTALVDHVRGRKEVADFLTSLAQQGHTLGVCGVSVVELFAGLPTEHRERADRLLEKMEYYYLTPEIARLGGLLRFQFARQGISLSTADTLIAAHAISEKVPLITRNVKDFPMAELTILTHP